MEYRDRQKMRPELSQEEFELAVMQHPEMLSAILINSPMALIHRIQADIDATAPSAQNEARQKAVNELTAFYQQRLDRVSPAADKKEAPTNTVDAAAD